MPTPNGVPNKPFWKERKEFAQAHPQLADHQPQVLGTYRTCRTDKVAGRKYVPLEEAYHHIFESNSGNGCKRCQRRLNSAIEHKGHSMKRVRP